MSSNHINEARATLYMLLAAGTFSLFPIVNLYGIRSIDAVTLSVLGLVISGLFLFFLVLASASGRALFLAGIRDAKTLAMLSLSGGFLLLSYVAFAESLHFIAPEITTVLFESHLVVLVFAAPVFVRRLTRAPGRMPYVTAALCFGIVLLLGAWEALHAPGNSLPEVRAWLGVLLAALSALAVTANVILRQLASDRLRQLQPGCVEFDVSVAANAISRFLPLLCIAFVWPSFSFDPSFLPLRDWGLLVFYGVVVIGLNNIFFLMAVNASAGSTVNALRYSGPVLSLILLWMLDEVAAVSFPLAFAYSAVVLTSFFTVTRPRDDPATIALIGSSVFITGLLSFVPGSSMSDYFAATVSPLVLFSVIVAFLFDRFKEASQALRMLRIEIAAILPDPGEARSFLRGLEAEAGGTLEAVFDMEKARAVPGLAEKSLKYLSLRATRVAFGEWIALVGSALVAIFAAVAYRSDGFLFDVYALFLSATLVFLIFQILTDACFPREEFPMEARDRPLKATPVILSLLVIALQLITLSG